MYVVMFSKSQRCPSYYNIYCYSNPYPIRDIQYSELLLMIWKIFPRLPEVLTTKKKNIWVKAIYKILFNDWNQRLIRLTLSRLHVLVWTVQNTMEMKPILQLHNAHLWHRPSCISMLQYFVMQLVVAFSYQQERDWIAN